ncbi:MAG TPA: ribose-phosphate pyrophosphokinase [bacterium]|nr:ribose-phosphate pyrophosphokinase [bacterium]
MDFLIFSNSCNTVLVKQLLNALRDIPGYGECRQAEATVRFHSDKEPFVEVLDNVRGRRCIVLACLSNNSQGSVNDHGMAILALLDALRRANAKIETLVLPYIPYARQDRRKGERTDRTAITAELFPRLLTCAAPQLPHVCALEPHDVHIEGFFQCPFDRIPVIHEFVHPIKEIYRGSDKIVVVSPDRGGWERVSALATMLGTEQPIAWIDKRRLKPGEAKAHQLVGEVADCDAVLVDDMIDTAGSMCEAARIMREEGARRVIACVVHGLFSGPALERIQNSDFEQVLVTSSVEQRPEVLACDKIRAIPVGGLLAKAIQRHVAGESLRELGKQTTCPSKTC